MSYERKFPDWQEQVEEASKTTQSATAAAAKLGVKYDTYKKYAIKYGCFETNQAGKGISKDQSRRFIPLADIFAGKHPNYQTSKLRQRLITDGYFSYKCTSCGLSEWLNKPIPLELEHINGDSYDHRLENLTILCPNCHAQTSTYRGKNKGKT